MMSDILASFRQFPEADAEDLLAGRRPLILAPHPDDESLGCGGLIAAACAAGLAPAVAILTDGAASHPGSREYPPARLRSLREQEARAAASCLGLPADHLYFLRAHDAGLPASGDACAHYVGILREIGERHGSRLVVAPWAGDPHCDHQAAAVMASMLAAQQGWALASYPLWGWLRDETERFDEPRQDGRRLRVLPYMARKQRAIAAHRSQYGALIQDAPAGFTLPEELLEITRRNYEVYIL